MNIIRRFIIRTLTPLVWRFSNKQKANAIMEFSAIEKDSGCQLLQCTLLIEDPKIKAGLFQHVLEEFFHAELFEDLAYSYSDKYFVSTIKPREYLVTTNSKSDEVVEAYAYAHIGELDVNQDFSIYGKGRFEKKIKNTFLRVAADEERHVDSTDDLLIKLINADKTKYNLLVWKSSLKIKYKKFVSMMMFIGELNLSIILSIFYFVFGVFLFKEAKSRFSVSSEDQLQMFKEQIAELKRKKLK